MNFTDDSSHQHPRQGRCNKSESPKISMVEVQSAANARPSAMTVTPQDDSALLEASWKKGGAWVIATPASNRKGTVTIALRSSEAIASV